MEGHDRCQRIGDRRRRLHLSRARLRLGKAQAAPVQQMRLAINEAPMAYSEGQVASRDIFMPLAMSAGLGGDNPFYVVPVSGNSYHDFGVMALGDTLDNYGHWAETYNASQLYPNPGPNGDEYYLCVYNGVQWQRTGSTPRSGVAPNPSDHDGTTSGWRRSRYAFASVVGRKADGWPSQLPADTGITISFPVPTYMPAGKSYPIDIVCKSEAGVTFVANGTGISIVSSNFAAGTFTIRLTADGIKSIKIDRSLTSAISSAFYLSGIPSWETGTPAADIGAPYISSVKKTDLLPFYGYRRLKAAAVERVGGTPEYRFTSTSVQTDGSTPGWRYEVDVANQLYASGKLKVAKFPIPDFADDNYITAYATYALNHLNAGIEARVTDSNEQWNDGSYVNAVRLNALASAAGITRQQMYARRVNHIVALWKAVWGSSAARVNGSAEWQSVASTTDLQSILDFENCYQTLAALSVAPYFGGGIGSTGIIGFYAYASTAMKNAVTANDQAAFNTATDALVRTAIDDAVAAMVTVYNFLRSYCVSKGLSATAIKLESYEAGQHLLTNESAWDAGLGAGMGARASALLAAYKRSATFATSVGIYLDKMQAQCPHDMFWFNYMGIIGYQGWGMMDKEGATTQEPYVTIKAKALAWN
jgi:hypothetical protein